MQLLYGYICIVRIYSYICIHKESIKYNDTDKENTDSD